MVLTAAGGAFAALAGYIRHQHIKHSEMHETLSERHQEERAQWVLALAAREKEFDVCLLGVLDKVMDQSERGITTSVKQTEALLALKGGLDIYGKIERLYGSDLPRQPQG